MRADVATMLLDRLGDEHLGLRTRDRDWTWDNVVRESAARISASLPVTGSNKVLKRELQRQRWHTDEPVYRWAGRGGTPVYHRMTNDEKLSLDAEFARHGQQRYT